MTSGFLSDVQREFFHGFPDTEHLARVIVRLAVAIALGAVVGLERQKEGKAAGMRTHMLVALGAAMFVLVPMEAGMQVSDVSRIIQGLAAGIGFLGAGTIVKLSDTAEVKGLTSAASIWVTASVGMAAGGGWIWPAIIGVLLSWTVLSAVHNCERWVRHRHKVAVARREHTDYKA
jgi:putative Mg2+ transporter-C (MgtC) family protein